jgi:hypothetical protein
VTYIFVSLAVSFRRHRLLKYTLVNLTALWHGGIIELRHSNTASVFVVGFLFVEIAWLRHLQTAVLKDLYSCVCLQLTVSAYRKVCGLIGCWNLFNLASDFYWEFPLLDPLKSLLLQPVLLTRVVVVVVVVVVVMPPFSFWVGWWKKNFETLLSSHNLSFWFQPTCFFPSCFLVYCHSTLL